MIKTNSKILIFAASLTAPLLITLLFLINAPSFAAGVIYVDASVNGGTADGSSWANAYPDLQSALASATAGDEVWVASGIYKPGSFVTNTFQLQTDVALYGGFSGSETNRSERDWSSNLTILSGDLESNDTVGSSGVLTDTANIVGSNSYHVVTGSGVSSTAILDGFVVTAGQATGASPYDRGGGLVNESGTPTITNVTFSGNAANGGGAVYNNQSAPTFTNVSFLANSASFDGGGMFNNNGSGPTVTNALFISNTATAGGGMFNLGNSSPVLTNVTMAANSVSGINARGGGLLNTQSNPVLVNTIIWGNSGASAPNLLNTNSTPTVSYSLIEGSGGSGSWITGFGTDGGSNLDSDPLFVTPTVPSSISDLTSNWQLQSSSPAIDTGSTISYTSPITTDLAGNSRIQNSVIDLGPLEFNSDPASEESVAYLPSVYTEESDDDNGNTIPTPAPTQTASPTADASPTETPAPTQTPTPIPTPEPATLSPGVNEMTINHTIEGEVVARTVYIRAPVPFDDSQVYPVVFAFHGAGGSGTNFVTNTHLNTLINAGEFIGVYPDGYANDGSDGGYWNLGNEATTADDIEFVHLIVNQLSAYDEIDRSQMYAMGYSNGSGMLNLVGKSTTYFRAIAPLFSQQSVSTSELTPSTTLSVFQLNGTADTLIPLNGGDSVVGTFVSAEESALNWAGHFNCSTTPATETLTWGTDTVDAYTYSGCDDGHVIKYHVAQGVGHTGFLNNEANQALYNAIWAFFEQH